MKPPNPFADLFVDERFGAEPDEPPVGDRIKLLEAQRQQLKQSRKRQISLRNTAAAAAAGVLLLAPAIGAIWGIGLAAIVSVVYAGLAIVFAMLRRQRIADLRQEILEIDNELDLLSIDDAPEERAHRLLQMHGVELQRYYDQTLRQGSSIFWVGIGCLAFGFATIATAIWAVSAGAFTTVTEQVVVAVLGAVGGALANFIAVIYLRMHSAIASSTAAFNNRLVATHHLHFGSFLVSKIDDRGARDGALADMARGLAGGVPGPSAWLVGDGEGGVATAGASVNGTG